MARRHEDWLAQARRDLKAAQDSLADENYEWCAFQAEQAAEKAAKALLRFHNRDVHGHTITRLLEQAESVGPIPAELLTMARELDRHYIQPRYPNAFAEGYPAKFYDAETAERCICYAEKILAFVESHLS
ncbi:MAG: HEPN domain-containing protein [candidate division WOR-3 bacterium]